MSKLERLKILEPLFIKHKGDYYAIREALKESGCELPIATYYRYRKLLSTPDERQLNLPVQEYVEPEVVNKKVVELPTPQADPYSKHTYLEGSLFVFTTAQADTRVHKEFLDNLLFFCKHNNAQLIVGKSCNSRSKDFDPYLKARAKIVDYSCKIATGVTFCGELTGIHPTAVNVFNGLSNYTGQDTCIIPHVKVQLDSVARRPNTPPKLLYSTGAITHRNYSATKAGHIASFHHVFGAVVVKIDSDGDTFLYNIIAEEDGSFHHLNERYANGSVTDGGGLLAIKWGDIHAERLDYNVALASWIDQQKSILDVLRPKVQFVEDLLDFTARSHHNINDRSVITQHYFDGHNSVEDALRQCGKVLSDMSRSFTKIYVTDANHNGAFDKWLNNNNKFIDPINEEIYFKYNYLKIKNIRERKAFSCFENAVREYSNKIYSDMLSKVVFLSDQDSFTLMGVQFADHGHHGANGSKGSPNLYASLCEKFSLGHYHKLWTKNGSTGAGTSSRLDLGYNTGFSSWVHGHTGMYPNGKRVQLQIINRKW